MYFFIGGIYPLEYLTTKNCNAPTANYCDGDGNGKKLEKTTFNNSTQHFCGTAIQLIMKCVKTLW